MDDGAQSNQLRKVPNEKLAEWDATHDAAGRAVAPIEEEIQVQFKSAETSSDDSASFAYGTKNDSLNTRDTSHV